MIQSIDLVELILQRLALGLVFEDELLLLYLEGSRHLHYVVFHLLFVGEEILDLGFGLRWLGLGVD